MYFHSIFRKALNEDKRAVKKDREEDREEDREKRPRRRPRKKTAKKDREGLTELRLERR